MRIAPSAPPTHTCATAHTGRTPTPSVSGVVFRVAATLVHMYVGKHTLKASFESTTGVSRGNRSASMSRATTTHRSTILNVAAAHAAATSGLNPTPKPRSDSNASMNTPKFGT